MNVKRFEIKWQRNLIFIQESTKKKFKKFLISILKNHCHDWISTFLIILFCVLHSPASMSYISLNFPVNNEIKFKFIFIVKILCLFYPLLSKCQPFYVNFSSFPPTSPKPDYVSLILRWRLFCWINGKSYFEEIKWKKKNSARSHKFKLIDKQCCK